jgi:hypothetical protein
VSRSGTKDVGAEVEDPDSDEIKFINASSDVSLMVNCQEWGRGRAGRCLFRQGTMLIFDPEAVIHGIAA